MKQKIFRLNCLMWRNKVKNRGFTLIEVSLSLVFIGILSISLVLIVTNTLASYRRGLTLNRINTVGMGLVDDMRSAIQNASIKPVTDLCTTYYSNNSAGRENCLEDGANSFVRLERLATVTINGDATLLPVYGALCTGTYTYIWNSGYFDRDDAISVPRATLTYSNGGSDITIGNVSDGSEFYLLKVHDPTRAVCVSVARPIDQPETYKKYSDLLEPTAADEYNNFNISPSVSYMGTHYGLNISEEPFDLISKFSSESKLVLYDLDVAPPAESSTERNIFYSISFILGTLDGGVNITASGKSCDTPSNYETENFDYCAINKFSFAAQANGNGGTR